MHSAEDRKYTEQLGCFPGNTLGLGGEVGVISEFEKHWEICFDSTARPVLAPILWHIYA